MSTKLTLTIDGQVIRKAKSYAYARGRSLSELVENYLKTLDSNRSQKEADELAPSVKSLMGSFKAPKDFDYKKILREEKLKKHG